MAISIVQTSGVHDFLGGAGKEFTWGVAPTAGNTIIAIWGGRNSSGLAVYNHAYNTPNRTNTFTQPVLNGAVNYYDGSGINRPLSVSYLDNIPSGISVTMIDGNGVADEVWGVLLEVSGLKTTGSFDQKSVFAGTNWGTGSDTVSATPNMSTADNLVLTAAFGGHSVAFTSISVPATGYGDFADHTGIYLGGVGAYDSPFGCFYQIVSSSTGLDAAWTSATVNASNTASMIIATFQAAEAAAGGGAISSSGSATFNAIGGRKAGGAAISSGTATVTAVGKSLKNAIMSASGVATMNMVGVTAVKATISAAAGSTVSFTAGQKEAAAISSAGAATVNMEGTSVVAGTAAFSAQGAATVNMVGANLSSGAAEMTGAATISWVGASTSTGSNVTLWGEVRRRQADRIRRIEQEDEELLRLVREAIAPAIIERLRKAA